MKPQTTKADNYQRITDTMVAALEAGTTPWICPWDKALGMPRNGASGHVYRGMNVWLVWAAGFGDPRWYTFNQVREIGERSHVRKGEKGTFVSFWRFVEKKDAEGNVVEKRPLLGGHCVFNHEQIEWAEGEEPRLTDKEPVEGSAVDATLDGVVAAHGMKVLTGGDRACYIPALDEIHMPAKVAFNSLDAYWATMLHEASHWTGHADRCNRDLKGRFGDEAYAMEELVAELSAAFLCGDFGVQGHLQHDAYLASWIKVLKGDKYAIFTAASLARKAAEYINKGVAVEQEDGEELAA